MPHLPVALLALAASSLVSVPGRGRRGRIRHGQPADLLADEVVFWSPAVFAQQPGKALAVPYLNSAMLVLAMSLRYVSKGHDHTSAVLEFEAELDGICVQGVDLLPWNRDGKLVSFTMMARPAPLV